VVFGSRIRLVGKLLGLLERLLGLGLSVAEPKPGLGLFLLRIAFVFGHGRKIPAGGVLQTSGMPSGPG
jgi:hypothetical protein